MDLDVIQAVIEEAEYAERNWGPFTSSHEAYGVLSEEVAELLEAIRSNMMSKIAREAVQVAAVAARLADNCGDAAFIKRSTP